MQDTQENKRTEKLVLLVLNNGFVVKVKESEVVSVLAANSSRDQ